MSNDELEELRKKRLRDAQRQMIESEQQAQVEVQKQAILRQIMTPEARERLTRIKIVKPEMAEQIELQLIQLAQAGRLGSILTDDQLKTILKRLTEKQRDIKITRK